MQEDPKRIIHPKEGNQQGKDNITSSKFLFGPMFLENDDAPLAPLATPPTDQSNHEIAKDYAPPPKTRVAWLEDAIRSSLNVTKTSQESLTPQSNKNPKNTNNKNINNNNNDISKKGNSKNNNKRPRQAERDNTPNKRQKH